MASKLSLFLVDVGRGNTANCVRMWDETLYSRTENNNENWNNPICSERELTFVRMGKMMFTLSYFINHSSSSFSNLNRLLEQPTSLYRLLRISYLRFIFVLLNQKYLPLELPQTKVKDKITLISFMGVSFFTKQ